MADLETRFVSRLPLERWREFRELRLLALESDPAAFGQNHATASGLDDDFWQDRLRGMLAGDAWIVFVEVSGRLQGMAGAFQSDRDRERCNATIWGVFLNAGERGRGLGAEMLGKLLDDLVTAGIRSATLAVNLEQTAAVHLYRRLGFQVTGHETVTLGDGLPHDELLMELTL